ncbi:MAG: YidC/Oxa1 family membrane protein insertase, partial [Planctomycetes bacterium]|nr:YidC/Oxa1 family membrane protein insertase [Planctomycetota bacterium]
FNLLPVLYVVLTMLNFKMQPRSDDPQAAAQQKMMGFMMIFFGFIFYRFASGFMLYIMTSAALGIAESKIIKAQLAREDLELESKQGGEAAAAPAGPLYKAKNKSAEKIVPSSAKKKKRRKRF